jgi:hypothetical protein
VRWFKLLLLKEEELNQEVWSHEFILRGRKMLKENGKIAIVCRLPARDPETRHQDYQQIAWGFGGGYTYIPYGHSCTSNMEGLCKTGGRGSCL